MKNLRFISAVAAACALFASQPALAAEMPFDTYGSAVITAGQGAAQGGGAEAPGQGTETVHFYGPGGQAGGAGETTGTVENVQAPAPESSGSASSPVITAEQKIRNRFCRLLRNRRQEQSRAGQKVRQEFLPGNCFRLIRVRHRQRQQELSRRLLPAAWLIRQNPW